MTAWLNGVRGRVVLVVFAVAACLYSLLGTFGFLRIANGGRAEIRERINVVIDQLEAGIRAGSNAVSATTADGVDVRVESSNGASFAAPPDVVQVRRQITVGDKTMTLIGSASQARLTESMRSLHRTMWLGIPFAVLLTTVVAAFAVRRALSPVSQITTFAASVTRHGTTSRVEVRETDDEIEELARTINAMLDRIEEGQAQQRQFTSDAAHELRTPLMALQGEIELAQRLHESIDPSMLERLDVLTKRLGSRVEDLVLLSSLDEHAPLRLERVSITDIVQDEAVVVGARITSGSDQDVSAVVDRRLIMRAVSNLLANASRHAHSSVEVSANCVDDRVVINVDDDGPGVPEEHASKIFQRFGRVDEARSDSGGPGLGLAIVASVASAHGGGVSVGPSALGGARFTLTVPSEGSVLSSHA